LWFVCRWVTLEIQGKEERVLQSLLSSEGGWGEDVRIGRKCCGNPVKASRYKTLEGQKVRSNSKVLGNLLDIRGLIEVRQGGRMKTRGG